MRTHALGTLILFGALVAPVIAGAQERQATEINYVNAPLGDVIRSLATALGLNVVLTNVPASRVTFATPRPVPVTELGGVLESILESNGLMLVQNGPVASVAPVQQAPTTGPVYFGRELPKPPPVGLITQVVPLQAIRADEGEAMLRRLAAPTAHIETEPRSNALLITDRGVNVARYLDLLNRLDVGTGGEAGLRTYVVSLKHASAVDLAVTLSRLFGVSVPEPEASPARALEERSLSRSLEGQRMQELQQLEQRRRQPIPILTQPPALPARDTGAAAATPGLVGQTIVVPNAATNALLIRTAPPNFPLLREVIDSLDTRPAQVLLEVLIAEVILDRSTNYGIDWAVVSGDATARFGPQQFTDSALAGVSDFLLRVVTLHNVDARGVLSALARRSQVRVLSTPHVLALNNEEARILVGSQVPFSQSTRTGLDVVVDRIVQFRNVGTQLTVIPTINQDGYVTFRILQEVSALTNQTIAAALDAPIITTREAETSALVKNGQTIVIGGLIDEQRNVVESGVPLLKDIPLLGYLFKSHSTSRTRTEVAIFVTPHVVLTDEDAQRLLERERGRIAPVPQDSGPPR